MSDKELVSKILIDSSYFGEIIDRYEQKLLRYILRISDISYEDGLDLLQEIFIKVYKNINDFDDNLSFSSWIFRIAHNLVIDNFRKIEKSKNNISLSDDEYSHIVNNISDNIDPSSNLLKSDLKDIVKKSLSLIRLEYREIIILRYLDNYSYDEISDILKIPTGTVATLLNRAKKELKEKLIELNFNF